ncbi:unnamed protein product [Anisakis simplex]|uniref:Tetraspanin n=1 Tax=Anisakis simplex TaxID=6269 RepID=A0A3P6QB25_ANISI|nr:unnamed protein product [Anisakis simplex]
MFIRLSMTRNRRLDLDDDSCCGLRLLKIIIYFFNFLFYISGIVLIGIGIWTFVYKWEYVSLLARSTYRVITYTAVFTGFSVIAVATFGCVGVAKGRAMFVLICEVVVTVESKSLSRVESLMDANVSFEFQYTLLLLSVLVLEGVLCIFAYSYSEQISNELNSSLMANLLRDHSIDTEISNAIETLHKQGKCCGALTFEDWRNSVWWQNVNTATLSGSRGFDLSVPDFCCRTQTTDCGRRDHPSNIYYDGCQRYLVTYMKEHLTIISGTAFALAVVQLIGTSFATCLFVKLRDFSKPDLPSARSHDYSFY